MLTLTTLKSPRGTNKNTKRIGRGQGSGQGTQAGKGHKGQKARNGGGVRIGFEGGQMPLYRRLPKIDYAVLNLEKLASKFTNEVVTRETLIEMGFLSGINKSLPIKILAKGEFNKPLTFKGIEKFSAKALELIKKANGKVENA
jgi:large subunit ribosomal protein L15